MSFITPSTALSGTVLPPSQWNDEVRDNISYLNTQLVNYQSDISNFSGSVTSLSGSVDAIYPQTIGTITADYEIGTSDVNKLYKVDPSGGTINIDIPSDLSISDGTKIDFAQTGSGTTLFSVSYSSFSTVSTSSFIIDGIASSSDGTKMAIIDSNGSNYIWTSSNSGSTWTAQTGSGTREWTSIASSSDGTKLVATVNNGQIYTSTDSGVNWTARDSNRYWTSVASSSDGTKLIAVDDDNTGYPGGLVYTSDDSGATWTATSLSYNWWKGAASSADGTKLVAVGDSVEIFTSVDSGASWTARDTSRSWRGVASSADGVTLAAITDVSVYVSTDSGATWTANNIGDPFDSSFENISMSADGTKIVLSDSPPFGSPDNMWISFDSGATWTNYITPTGSPIVNISSNGQRFALGGNNYNIYLKDFDYNILLNYTPSNQLRTQYSAASIIRLNDTNYLLTGDLA